MKNKSKYSGQESRKTKQEEIKMPKEISSSKALMEYRPEIKVLDATIRDGGLVNSFRFTDEFITDLYHANVAAGVDYMELVLVFSSARSSSASSASVHQVPYS